ncbi:hypothetical protein GQ53DRAFT_854046 [Thozetella sp. PMI_491]|nr:hypothetical protein GQ53DRAFT_854046 [Thozetella sp. PMI_491]
MPFRRRDDLRRRDREDCDPYGYKNGRCFVCLQYAFNREDGGLPGCKRFDCHDKVPRLLQLHIGFIEIELKPRGKMEKYLELARSLEKMTTMRMEMMRRLKDACTSLTDEEFYASTRDNETHEIDGLDSMIEWAHRCAKKALAALDEDEIQNAAYNMCY